DVVDIYWAGGVRYGHVASVSSNALTVDDDGAGDDLPDNMTAVTVCVRQAIDIDFSADLAAIIAMVATKRAHVDIQDSGGTELAIELTAGEPWQWLSGQGVANPLDSDVVDSIHVSNGDSTGEATVTIGVLYDSV